jgi:hypothetical protein
VIVPPVADHVAFPFGEPVTVAENCFVFPSCNDAELGLTEIVIAGGGGFVPGLVVDPVQEVKPTIARITQTRSKDADRVAAALVVFGVRVGDLIGFVWCWQG